jgi:hypothetical protein
LGFLPILSNSNNPISKTSRGRSLFPVLSQCWLAQRSTKDFSSKGKGMVCPTLVGYKNQLGASAIVLSFLTCQRRGMMTQILKVPLLLMFCVSAHICTTPPHPPPSSSERVPSTSLEFLIQLRWGARCVRVSERFKFRVFCS